MGANLRSVDKDLWVAEQPLRFGPVQLGTRMTVIRLSDSSLVLYSPVTATESLQSEANQLGRVAYLVAPNKLHHLYVSSWAERYPESRIYAAPGVGKKRPDLAVSGVLPESAPESWSNELQCIFFEGLPFANEVVFFHASTRTLLTCDLAFNVGPEAHWFTRFNFWLAGRYNDFGPTRLERFLIRDRPAAKRSLERILDLGFERVIVTHGEILERGGVDAMKRGYEWLLRS